MRELQNEIRLRPNLAQMNSKTVQIEQLESEMEFIRTENNTLQTEIMHLRNKT